ARLAGERHRAGAADAVRATEVRAGEPEVFSQHLGQGAPGLGVDRSALAVHDQLDAVGRAHAAPPARAPASARHRLVITATSCCLYAVEPLSSAAGSTLRRATSPAARWASTSSLSAPISAASTAGRRTGMPSTPNSATAAAVMRPPSALRAAAAPTSAKSPLRRLASTTAAPCPAGAIGKHASVRISSSAIAVDK